MPLVYKQMRCGLGEQGSQHAKSLVRTLEQANDFASNLLEVSDHCIAPLKALAELWRNRPIKQKVSVTEFLHALFGYVLLLPNDLKNERACRNINRAFIAYASRTLLRKYAHLGAFNSTNRCWFILDDEPQLGEFPELLTLLTKGEGTGA